jgi:hypothetical protein
MIMRPFWSSASASNKRLIMTGASVDYGSATNSMVLPADRVFPGGIALAFWTNRDNASLPATPSGWTLLQSGVLGTNHSGIVFGKKTPVSQVETLTLSVTGKNGSIWGMKYEDGSPIAGLRLGSNSPAPVVSNISGTVSNIAATKLDQELLFALGLLWQRGDLTIAEAITGLEGSASTLALFSFESASDAFRGVFAPDESAIRAATGAINFGASGLTSGNSMVHMPVILDLSEPPPALTATYRGAGQSAVDAAAGSTYTFNQALTIPGSADRYVVVAVGLIAIAGANVAPLPSSVTVDGVPLTLIKQLGSTPGSGISTALFGGIVDTPATTVSVLVTNSVATASGCCIATATITGSPNVSPVWSDAQAYANGDANLGTHSLEPGECMIFFGNHFGDTATFTWVGATESNELNYDTRARTSMALRNNTGSSASSQTTSFTSSGGDGVFAYGKFSIV